MTSLWDALYPELQQLVLEHRAAQIIQSALLRVFRFKHARRREWPAVRQRLGFWAVRALWPYPLVRREWRMEPGSWRHPDATLLRLLIEEAREGFWGKPNRVLVELSAEFVSGQIY